MMEKSKSNIEIPQAISELTGGEFLSFLYSERNREESLNSYQGWNAWVVMGALITVVCTIYGIVDAHVGELDRARILYLVSRCLGTIFFYWQAVSFYMSFIARKRAKDYKRIKRLKDVAPVPYLMVVTVCSLMMALCFVIFNVINDVGWNTVSISWIVLAVSHLLICINVYVNRNAIVWAVKDDVWFARTWHMLAVGLFVFAFFWLIWKWSRENVLGPFVGTSEFELAACFTAIVMLVYLLLKIKFANRKSSEIDVLIDEYVYKGKSKEDVYWQLRANQMGYGVLETCSQELYALKRYYDDFNLKRNELAEIKSKLGEDTLDADNVLKQLTGIRESLDYIDKWFERVDALQKKLDIIARNVSELKTDEEFVNLQKIVGTMTNKGEEIQKDIKVALEYCQKTVEKMFSSIGTGDGNGV